MLEDDLLAFYRPHPAAPDAATVLRTRGSTLPVAPTGTPFDLTGPSLPKPANGWELPFSPDQESP